MRDCCLEFPADAIVEKSNFERRIEMQSENVVTSSRTRVKDTPVLLVYLIILYWLEIFSNLS